MGITLEMVIGVVVLTVLGLLLTGPGMWSEKWGWKFLRPKDEGTGGAAAEDPRGPPAPPRQRR